jgi:hypothetical protein
MRKEPTTGGDDAAESKHSTLQGKVEKMAGKEEDLSFFLRELEKPVSLEGWPLILSTLGKHKSRVFDEKKARFVIGAITTSVAILDALPLRSIESPYVLWGYDRGPLACCPEVVAKAKERGDVLMLGYDLRPIHNATGGSRTRESLSMG